MMGSSPQVYENRFPRFPPFGKGGMKGGIYYYWALAAGMVISTTFTVPRVDSALSKSSFFPTTKIWTLSGWRYFLATLKISALVTFSTRSACPVIAANPILEAGSNALLILSPV